MQVYNQDWKLSQNITTEIARENAAALISKWRYEAEQAGVVEVDWVCFSTSREERASLAQAITAGVSSQRRKCAHGTWAVLPNAKLKAGLNAVNAHVQTLFDKEAEEAEAIATMELPEILKRYS